MYPRYLLPIPFLCLLASCETLRPGRASAPRDERAVETSPVGPAAVAAPPPSPDRRQAPPAGILSQSELGVLGTPEFRKRFLDSFVSDAPFTPGMDDDERELIGEAIALFSENKLREAAERIEAGRSDTSSAILDFYLGNVHYQAEELGDAAACYELAVQKHPRYQKAWNMLAEVHYREKDYVAAIRAFASTLKLGGGDDVTYGMLGRCHFESGNFVAAETAFRSALMLAPETVEWKIGLAESFFRQERYADAAAYFGSLIDADPGRPELWNEQGRAFALMGDLDKASQNFEIADELGGSTASSLMRLGNIYANEGMFALSVDAYRRAMAREGVVDIDQVLLVADHIARSGALVECQDLLDGIKARFGDALDVEAQTAILKLEQRIAAGTGAAEDALATLHEIIRLDPLDGEALLLLGTHYMERNEHEQAILYFERAAGIESVEADAKLRQGEVLVKQGKYRDAIPYIKASYAIQGRDFVRRYLEDVERAAQKR